MPSRNDDFRSGMWHVLLVVKARCSDESESTFRPQVELSSWNLAFETEHE